MDFFKHFPRKDIEFNVNGERKVVNVTDIMTAVRFQDTIPVEQDMMYLYQWKDSDVIDRITSQYYQSVGLWWLVLMSNRITDPQTQMPVPSSAIVNRAIEKWRQTAVLNGYENNVTSITEFMQTFIYEYRDDDGDIIDEETYNQLPATKRQQLTILEYEVEQNDLARQVELVDNTKVNDILSRFERLMEAK